MGSAAEFYDAFSQDYDRFVNWKARLAFELPLITQLLEQQGATRVLDVACGSGQHAVALAQAGYRVSAADISSAMAALAQANAARAGVTVDIRRAGFGELALTFGRRYDALLCLGNSLPHLTDEQALAAALEDFKAALAPGGLVLLQNRNFDRVLARHERFLPPEEHALGEREWIFWRFYDFEEGLLRFNLLRLQRSAHGPWKTRLDQTLLKPWTHTELTQALRLAGLTLLQCWGSLQGKPFDGESSNDLVLLAQNPLTTR